MGAEEEEEIKEYGVGTGLLESGAKERATFTLDDDDEEVGGGGRARGQKLPPSSSAAPGIPYAHVTFVEIAKQFAVLGWTAFGGPAAHIATFERVFVSSKSWLSSQVFTEFLALGQCVSGPTSTQMAFAIGVVKKGTMGGLLSGSMFLHPGFILMSILGAATGGALGRPSALVRALVAGFTAVAIALVAGAAAGLGKKVCQDKVTTCILTVSAAVCLYSKAAFVMPLLMLVGGAVTLVAYRKKDFAAEDRAEGGDIKSLGLTTRQGGILLAVWVSLLSILLIVVAATKGHLWGPLSWFSTFYTAGSLIFGGGQVLLPLLLDQMTSEGTCGDPTQCPALMTEDQFYAGLAAAQSMPGPLFNFSAYLGAVIAHNAGYWSFFGTLVCWVGLFAPGIMLIFGVLPFWGTFRRFPLYKRALPGINSAAVGLIFTAVFRMTFQAHEQSPFPKASTSIGVLSFTAVQHLGVPAPVAVIAGGCLGMLAHAARLH
uniref:Chromate transporter n=1 Tax=Chloropicon roscoffensis TaxID=1461544 RepID=A0A7S3CFB4_9CHLO